LDHGCAAGALGRRRGADRQEALAPVPAARKPARPPSEARIHKRINISTVLAGQRLGIKEVDEGIWLASFMHYDLGYFDLEQKTLQPLDNPFGPRLSPMS
jgi:hypothetical protein